MQYLFPEIDKEYAATTPATPSIAQSWCDPSRFTEVIGLDFGGNAVHYYKARSGKRGQMPFKELTAWLLRLPQNTLVVCESAHLGVPQTELSLAQPFTAEQLLALYAGLASSGVTLKLAPHAHTGRRMRLWAAHHYTEVMRDSDKSDAGDAMALAVYVDNCNEIALAEPYKSFSQSVRRNFGRKVTRLSNAVLNAERTNAYGGAFYTLIIKLARNVRRRAFCLGEFTPESKLKLIVTVASTLVSEKRGRLVLFYHRGHLPGRTFWMRDVLLMSAWHHRGGVARSNLMWHLFRPYLQRRAQVRGLNIKQGQSYNNFAVFNSREKETLRMAKKSFRQVLLQCRDLCLDEARLIGAGTLELTEVIDEVTDGR